jgi:hypothetical protein
MANFKRKKSRQRVRCLICTNGRMVKAGRSITQRGGRANQPKFWPTIKDQEEAG